MRPAQLSGPSSPVLIFWLGFSFEARLAGLEGLIELSPLLGVQQTSIARFTQRHTVYLIVTNLSGHRCGDSISVVDQRQTLKALTYRYGHLIN